MLLILKIPIVYLCVVVWWAIKAEPSPPDPTEVAVVPDTASAGWLGATAANRRAADPAVRTLRGRREGRVGRPRCLREE